jgi:hypothetical protein
VTKPESEGGKDGGKNCHHGLRGAKVARVSRNVEQALGGLRYFHSDGASS